MKTILLLLTCLFASTASAYEFLDEHDAAESLEYVCGVLKVDCTDIPPPKISYVNTCMTFNRCVAGMFIQTHTDTIFLEWENLNTPGALSYSTLIHETTHYVDWHVRITNMQENVDYCESEKLAYYVENLWSLENRQPPTWNWRIYVRGCYLN